MRPETRRARVSRTVVEERRQGAARRREAAANSGAHAINREQDFGYRLTRAETATRVAACLDELKNRVRLRARKDGRLHRSHNHRQPAPAAAGQAAPMAPSMDVVPEECNTTTTSSSPSDADSEPNNADQQPRKRRKTALTPRQDCGVDLAVRVYQDSLQQVRNSRRPSHALHRSNASSQVAREELAFQTWCYVNGLKTPTDMARQAIQDAKEHGYYDELMTEGGMVLKTFAPADLIRMRYRLGMSWTKSKILFHQMKSMVHSSQMAVSNWNDVIVARDAYVLPTIEKVPRYIKKDRRLDIVLFCGWVY